MLQVGIAGIGFMGMIHYLAWQRVPGARVTAISSRTPRRLAGDWRGIKGNFGPAGTRMDLAGIATYRELDGLLADPSIDLVDLCLPTSLHAPATLAALGAGKHVLCEKPISLHAADAKRMVAAAQAAGRQLLVGHVLPFFPEYAFAYRAIRDGQHGRLLGARFTRVISDPLWLSDYYDPDTIGGPLLDLHIHDAHFIRLACGMPRGVYSRGRMRGEVVEYVETEFLFDDPALLIGASGGVIRQQGRSFRHAYEIQLERATLLFDFAMFGGRPHIATPLTVLDDRGRVRRPTIGSGDPLDGFVAEMKEVTQSLRNGKPSPILGSELARDALLLCHKQTESVKTGRIVKI